MKNKKGLSQVIETVLFILLAIAIAGILLPFFTNFIRDKMGDSGVKVSLFFAQEPSYNNDSNSLCIIVERGAEDVELSGIQVITEYGGTSNTYLKQSSLPVRNGRIMYQVTLDEFPENVKLSATVNKGGKDIQVGILSESIALYTDQGCNDGKIIADLDDLPPRPGSEKPGE